MSLFVCDVCNCVENTALAGAFGYWLRDSAENPHGDDLARCSECNTGAWHGRFEKVPWDGERGVINR